MILSDSEPYFIRRRPCMHTKTRLTGKNFPKQSLKTAVDNKNNNNLSVTNIKTPEVRVKRLTKKNFKKILLHQKLRRVIRAR